MLLPNNAVQCLGPLEASWDFRILKAPKGSAAPRWHNNGTYLVFNKICPLGFSLFFLPTLETMYITGY